MTAEAVAKPARQPGIAIGALLAFAGGYVDTVGFVALFGLFTAHVTGNFVLIGASLFAFHSGLIAKLLALPVFALTVAMTRIHVLNCERQHRPAIATMLIAQMLLLAGFMAVGLLAAPIVDGDAPLAILAGLLGVAAMAIQNAAARTVFAALAPTTIMTGNVTQIVIDLVDIASLRADAVDARNRLRKMVPAVLSFATGALAGALLYLLAGFLCLILPIAAIGVVFYFSAMKAAKASL